MTEFYVVLEESTKQKLAEIEKRQEVTQLEATCLQTNILRGSIEQINFLQVKNRNYIHKQIIYIYTNTILYISSCAGHVILISIHPCFPIHRRSFSSHPMQDKTSKDAPTGPNIDPTKIIPAEKPTAEVIGDKVGCLLCIVFSYRNESCKYTHI